MQRSPGPVPGFLFQDTAVLLKKPDQNVGAGLLANAVCQSPDAYLTHCIREQARSHTDCNPAQRPHRTMNRGFE